MSSVYTVQQGDCMSSIAMQFGFFWQTIWDLPENSDLKENRKNPNVLLEGDQVTIPDLRTKQESRATNARYRFKRKGVPEKLRLRFLDANQKPRANLPYKIVIDGNARTGKTNDQGELTESIPPDAEQALLTLNGDTSQTMTVNLGHINPVTTISGVKGRLKNLGYYKGSIDENDDAPLKSAVEEFQKKEGLTATGNIDDATRSKILDEHGH